MSREQSKYTLRIDVMSLYKFKYIARYNGRSANSELQMIIRRYIRNFEEKNGEIKKE